MTMLSLRRRALLSASALVALGTAAPGLAQTADQAGTQSASPVTESQATDATTQDEADPATEVVVTGSRIARPEFDTLQPTQVIGAAQIENRGYTNVG